MIMKRFTLYFLFLILVLPAFPQSHGLVKWMSIEEAEKKTKDNPKPILIDIYTDWCGWCKRMMATTYSDPQVAGYINQNFYPVAFNAETHDTIRYQGETFVNKEPGKNGTHQLAYKFLPKSRSYPSTIFMDGNMQNSTLVPGYLESNTIAPILVFYKEKLFGSDINQFMAYFDSTFTPGKSSKQKAQVKWMDFQEALNQNLKKPKKILVDLYLDECISCKVMDSTSFTHPAIAAYINENFYPVRFNARSTDTINLLNQTLVNTGNYHQLAAAALKNKMNDFPALLFFNEKNELITPVPEYMPPKFLEAVLTYFKKDVYLQKQFPDFLKEFKGSI